MIVLIPAWVYMITIAFRCVRWVIRHLLEAIFLAGWGISRIVYSGYETGRRRADPFFETAKQIRKLPDTSNWFRRTVHR